MKMRISGAFASESGGTARSERASGEGSSRGRLRAYILAVAWVVVALAFYAYQMVKLAGLG